MLDLFGREVNPLPKGFSYYPNFITPAEESSLISNIQNIQLQPMNFHGYEAKRKVKSFGFDYSFEKRALTKGHPLPEMFHWLVERVSDKFSLPQKDIAELLITEYPTGSVINWHRDAPPFEVIIGVSLLSNCIFKFKPHHKENQTRKATISIPVERRSAYVIRDDARDAWQHSIAPVQDLRYSITLRTLRIKKG